MSGAEPFFSTPDMNCFLKTLHAYNSHIHNLSGPHQVSGLYMMKRKASTSPRSSRATQRTRQADDTEDSTHAPSLVRSVASPSVPVSSLTAS